MSRGRPWLRAHQHLSTAGFVEYFGTIRPWLATQSSVMLNPESFDESATGPFFSITVAAPHCSPYCAAVG